MENKEARSKGNFPTAMEDMGIVEEMGSMSGGGQEPPMVEITRREPWETTEGMAQSEVRENR